MSLYRVEDDHPYLDRQVERTGLTLDEAVRWVEDHTGIDEEQVLDDVAEEGGLPWRWEDPETGRTVLLRLEVE